MATAPGFNAGETLAGGEKQMKALLAILLLSVMAVAQESQPAVKPGAQPETQPSSAPAQAAPAQPTQAQPVQAASMVIFREGHFTGSALTPSLYVDGKEVARIKNGSYFTMPIEPGNHELSSSAKHESPLPLEIKPGETSYVQLIVVTGTWRGAGRLVPVPPDDGKIAVSKLKVLSD